MNGDRAFDIFEARPDGMYWRAYVRGLENVPTKLREMSSQTEYEYVALDVSTKTVVGRISKSKDGLRVLSPD